MECRWGGGWGWGEGIARAASLLCAFAGCHGIGSQETHGIYVLRHNCSLEKLVGPE